MTNIMDKAANVKIGTAIKIFIKNLPKAKDLVSESSSGTMKNVNFLPISFTMIVINLRFSQGHHQKNKLFQSTRLPAKVLI